MQRRVELVAEPRVLPLYARNLFGQLGDESLERQEIGRRCHGPRPDSTLVYYRQAFRTDISPPLSYGGEIDAFEDAEELARRPLTARH